jgi:putative transposase
MTRGRDGEVQGHRNWQKFAAAHTSTHNHFTLDRHLNRRDISKQIRSAGLAKWRPLTA